MPTCKGLRQELIDCLLTSDCVLVHKRSLKECLSQPTSNDDAENIAHPQNNNNKIHENIFTGEKATDEQMDTLGVPEKCRRLQTAHQICIKHMASDNIHIQSFYFELLNIKLLHIQLLCTFNSYTPSNAFL